MLRHVIEGHLVVVLQLEVRHVDVMCYNLSALTADWNVRDARLPDSRLLEVQRLIKPNLIKEQDYVLAGEPFKNLVLAGTADTFAHLELEGELLGLGGVVVAPNLELISVQTLKFFLVCQHFIQ